LYNCGEQFSWNGLEGGGRGFQAGVVVIIVLMCGCSHSENGQPTTYVQDFQVTCSHAFLLTPPRFISVFYLQSNLGDMLTILQKSRPYFVRCIKVRQQVGFNCCGCCCCYICPLSNLLCLQSNDSQAPGQFDRDVVSAQVQHMAVFETVDLVQSSECVS